LSLLILSATFEVARGAWRLNPIATQGSRRKVLPTGLSGRALPCGYRLRWLQVQAKLFLFTTGVNSKMGMLIQGGEEK
jgi:hypothetical protein